MANNEGYVEVIAKIKPANRTGFKVADSTDIEYNGKINASIKDENNKVTNAQDAIDHVYDIISATPMFWLVDNSKLTSDGSTRLNVKIGTSSPQGNTVKLTITNTTTGAVQTLSGLPINSIHSVDLGVISTFGTYNYTITAVDNYNNAMTVDKTKSSIGSFNADDTNEQYQLNFSVVAGTVKLAISSIDSSTEINGSKKIYEADKNGNNKVDITVSGTIQYPEVNSSSVEIIHKAKYQILARNVYFSTGPDTYISAYKYFALVNRNIAISANVDTSVLYYKYETVDTEVIRTGYISVDDYNENECLLEDNKTRYILASDDAAIGIFYDFVENNEGKGEYIISGDTYVEITDATSSQTYDFVPCDIETDVYDATGAVSLYQSKLTDSVNFTISDAFFLTEGNYQISAKAVVTKTIIETEISETAESMIMYSNIYPIYITDNAEGQPDSLRIVPVVNVPTNVSTDDSIDISFILVSSKSNVQNNIKFTASLYYRPAAGEDLELKEIIREGCANLSTQQWNIGRVTKGSGEYYYKIVPSSYDGSVMGDEYIYHFMVSTGTSGNAQYTTDGLVAYWDAQRMSNDMKNPDIWYPISINNGQEVENTDFYIKLFGLNYNTNGWVDYKEGENKHPHLKFTGDSYGLAYRKDSSGKTHSLCAMDLMDTSKVPAWSTEDTNEMTFEVMFRTRCVGEMKACVLSSRQEESRQLPLYTYSDTDSQIAYPGITISYNKAIINTNKDYLNTPFTEDEWKHIVFVVNRNVDSDLVAPSSNTSKQLNYNPFSSMRIYVNGVLTSVKNIPASDTDTSKAFESGMQLVLNAHEGISEIENFGSSEIRLIRMYNKALSNDQIVSNYINSIYDLEDRSVYERKNSTTINTVPVIYFVRNSEGEDANSQNIRKDKTENTTFNRLMNITDKQESKTYFVNCTMYYSYPDPEDPNNMLLVTYNNVDVYLQGTSTLQFPVKNLKIRLYANAVVTDSNGREVISTEPGGKKGAKKLKFLPPNMAEWVADDTFTLKCDYMESGHLNNTPTAKFYHNVIDELIKARVDGENGDERKLSKKEYRYTQDIVKGTYYINDKGEYADIATAIESKEIPENYSGARFSRTELTTKNTASPSRDYFKPVRDDYDILHYTSAMDNDPDFGHVHLMDKVTGLTDNQVTITDDNRANIVYYYEKANTYYIRKYNSSYKLEWVEYDPTDESHYGKILYKLDTRYRDSIDGFPCIVYYTDKYMGYTTDINPLLAVGDLKLLGTMMFNYDKTAKAIGFEVEPVFENEYDEYLKFIYNTEDTGFDSFEDFKKDIFTNGHGTYTSFEDFYHGKVNDGYQLVQLSEEELTKLMSDTSNGTLNSEIAYYTADGNRYYEVLAADRPKTTWYKKEIIEFTNSDDIDFIKYGTIPAYTYDQQYVPNDSGTYRKDPDDNSNYVLADESYNGQRYKLVFNDYRTYHIIDDSDELIPIEAQNVISYEATTNTKYAAGTFYDIDEAYNQTYEDDFVNQYYGKYFLKDDGETPLYVEDCNGEMISPVVNNSSKEVVALGLSDFKNDFMGPNSTLHMDALDLNIWGKRYELFYIDESEAGPYVYIYNGAVSIYSTEKPNGEFVLYDKTIHGLADGLRYKFALKYKSYEIIYKVDSNGSYYYDETSGKYKQITDSSFNGTKYIISHSDTANEFTINDKRSYIADKLSGDDESYLKYLSESFEARYSYVDENDLPSEKISNTDKATFLAMKRLIKWVIESVKETDDISNTEAGKNRFRDEFREHFDLTYAIGYYLQMITLAQADNAGKNSMWDTWDGKKFYIRPYDMDTQCGLNNKGLFNVPSSAEINIAQSPREFTDNTSTKLGNISNWNTDIDHIRYSSYTTATSRFWNAFAEAFAGEIQNAYAALRNSGIYTVDYITSFYKRCATDIIGEKYYNEDMNAKYLSQGDPVAMGQGNEKLDYLALLMGNRLDQFSKWIEERIIFCDTYFNYIENDTLNTQLDIRAQTTNSTAAIGISVFSPQYVKISVGSTRDGVFTAFVDTNSKYTLNGIEYEGTLFTLPITGNNKEISIYGGGNIKEIANIGDLKASTLNLGAAKKIIKLEIAGNNYIESLNLANATYLRELNVSNCVKLVGNLDVSNSVNLHTLNISKSGLSGVSLASGGNLKKFIASDTSISTVEFINLQQLTDVQISNSTGIIPVTTYIMTGCPLIRNVNLDKYLNITRVEIKDCDDLAEVSINGNSSLSTLVIEKCDKLRNLSLRNCQGSVFSNLNLSTVYGLERLDISNSIYDNGINVILPFFNNEEVANDATITIENATWNDRWHNLKHLVCYNSSIKSVTYGNADVNLDTINLEPLNMLTSMPNFRNCNKIKRINGMTYKGSVSYSSGTAKSMFYDSTISELNDCVIYPTNSSFANYLFYGCDKLKTLDTLLIDPIHKNTGSKVISLTSTFYSAALTTAILKNFIKFGRDFDLTYINNNSSLPASSKDFGSVDYVVRDTRPYYGAKQLLNNTLYVYDNNAFREYNSEIDVPTSSNPVIVTYFKDLNGSYIYNKFGLYANVVVDTLGNKSYINIDSVYYTLKTGENIQELGSEYKIDGTVISSEDGKTYYYYYNGSWTTITGTSFYTYYDMNSDGIKGRDSSGEFNIDEIGKELYNGERFSDGNDTTSITNKFYRVYIPENYTDEEKLNLKVYKKNFKESTSSTYISSISSIARNSVIYYDYYINSSSISDIPESYAFEGCICKMSNGNHYRYNGTSWVYYSVSNILEITSGMFDGLDRCTSLSTAFYYSKLSSINASEFQKLKKLDSLTIAFSGTNITTLQYDIFKNCTELDDISGAFMSCGSFRGFIDGSSNRRYYLEEGKSIIPSSVTNARYAFNSTAIDMQNNDLNDILSGLENLKTAYCMFKDCKNIKHIRTQPFKDLKALTNAASIFEGCEKLNVQNIITVGDSSTTTIGMLKNADGSLSSSDNQFVLYDYDIVPNNYPLSDFSSAFYGCLSLTGFIGEKFFNSAPNITTLGCNYGKNGSPANGATLCYAYGGTFANTGINSYHKDFLNPLTNLTNISCLFAKLSGNVVPTGNYSNRLAMYGYFESDGTDYIMNSGIPEDLFKYNTELTNVSYLFAGNQGLDRDSSELTYISKPLPNIFAYCPKIKYMAGCFMGTSVHKTAATSSLTTDGKVYLKGSNDLNNPLGYAFNTDEFFKYISDDGDFVSKDGIRMRGMDKLISVKSLFENSNYTVYNNKNQDMSFSEDMFKGCISLSDVSRMFKDNMTLTVRENVSNSETETIYALPIGLFNDCRSTLSTTKNMFAGCEKLSGVLPIGDNTLLVAYNNYLDNLKNDPDVILAYPEIATISIGKFYDNITAGNYNTYSYIESYTEMTGNKFTKILSFDEFIEKVNSKLYKTLESENITSFADPIRYNLTVSGKDKYSKSSNEGSIFMINNIQTVYLKDRIENYLVSEADVGLYKITSSEALSRITTRDIGTRVNYAIYGEIGTYGYSNETYLTLKDLGSSYDYRTNGKYVPKSMIIVDSNDENAIINAQVFNFYYTSKNSENHSIYTDSSGIAEPFARNRRIIPNNYVDSSNLGFLIPQENSSLVGAIINGPVLAEYTSNNNQGIFIKTPVLLTGTETEYEYKRGLLGSCRTLTTSAGMFQGCINLNCRIPQDIFSSESPNNNLSNLEDISSMFLGCVRMGVKKYNDVTYSGIHANPYTMYERDPNNYDFVIGTKYIVPSDWLINCTNIKNVSHLFQRVGNTSEKGENSISRGSINGSSYLGGENGLIIPNELFSNQKIINDASYLAYCTAVISGTLDNQFLRSSISSLENISRIFVHTSISNIGTNSSLRIFETSGLNNKLNNVEASFFGCDKLTYNESSGRSYEPRFYNTSKFNALNAFSSYQYCFAGTSLGTTDDRTKYKDFFTDGSTTVYIYYYGNNGFYSIGSYESVVHY